MAGLILVFAGDLTGWTLLVIVIVLAVYLGLLQLIAAWAREVARGVNDPGGDGSGVPDPGASVTSGAA